MPLKKHVHCHGLDKSVGKQWVIEFETVSSYKTPLMSWTSGSTDPFYSKGDNMTMVFPSVNSAVEYATTMGWGIDVSYPNYKYHTLKNYADNFKFKGGPKPEADYD